MTLNAEPATVAPVDGVFHGWRIVAAAFTVLFVVYSIQFSFGTLVDDIVDDTGWSETRLQLIYALYILAYSLLSAVSGILTDRYGPRRVVGAGAVILGIGYLSWAAAPNLWVVLFGLGIAAPIGMSASWVPCNATVVRWFVARRGLAVAVATAGGSLANIVAPPISAAIVQARGWRTALASMAIVGIVAMSAGAAVMRRDPESVGQHPDGRPPSDTNPEEVGGATLAEAFRTRPYWLIFGMYALSFLAIFVPFAHISQFATDQGIDAIRAATVISAIGIGGFSGRLIVGPVSDRFDRRRVVAVAFAIQTAGFVGLAMAQSLTVLYPSAAAFGFAYGSAVALFPALVGDYFGRAHAGAIVGRLFATAGAMAAVGPYVAQLLVDGTDSYRFAFTLCAVANGAALLMAAQLPHPELTRRALSPR